MFSPTVETVNDEQAFLAEHPLDIMRQGRAQRVPWMTGYNSHEGLLSSPSTYIIPMHTCA